MTQYQKGTLVMNYLRNLEASPEEIPDAICDTNLEISFKLITENPQITAEELMKHMLPDPDEEYN